MAKIAFKAEKQGKGQKKLAVLFCAGLIFCFLGGLLPSLSGQIYKDQARNSSKSSEPAQQKKKVLPKREQKESGASKDSHPDQASIKAILKENRFLEEELSLARNPKYYFVIDLKDRKVELRARGMILKSWTASQIRYSGRPVPLKVITLSQKSALNPPERRMIKPGEGDTASRPEPVPSGDNKKSKKDKKQQKAAAQEPASSGEKFELQALEITDMPGNYELIFDNGLEIAVRSENGKGQKLKRLKENIAWYIFQPVKNLLSKNKNLNPKMILYFEEMRPAQGIYWAFIDNIQGIIWLP
ncbi:MAG TPA: hypothetical protein PKU99_09650 [Candidatus Saccharicenans sp.]|nr:hypothetical protein [Candidatus Saccharicenans sp.]